MGTGTSGGGGPIILNKEGEYEIARFTDGTIRWAFANSNPGWSWRSTGFVAPLNTWTHIAVVYNNGIITTYGNGTAVHTFNGSGSIGDVVSGQDELWIGNRMNADGGFDGIMDEIKLYNKALSDSQIQSLYHTVPEIDSSLMLLTACLFFIIYKKVC